MMVPRSFTPSVLRVLERLWNSIKWRLPDSEKVIKYGEATFIGKFLTEALLLMLLYVDIVANAS